MTGRVRRCEKVSMMSTRECVYFVVKNPPPPMTKALNRLTLSRDERGWGEQTLISSFGPVSCCTLHTLLNVGTTATHFGDGVPKVTKIQQNYLLRVVSRNGHETRNVAVRKLCRVLLSRRRVFGPRMGVPEALVRRRDRSEKTLQRHWSDHVTQVPCMVSARFPRHVRTYMGGGGYHQPVS